MALVAYYDYVLLFANNSLQSSILRLVFNSFLGLIILFFFCFFPYLTQVVCAAHAAPLTCALVLYAVALSASLGLHSSRIVEHDFIQVKNGIIQIHPSFFFCNAPIYTKELTDMKE